MAVIGTDAVVSLSYKIKSKHLDRIDSLVGEMCLCCYFYSTEYEFVNSLAEKSLEIKVGPF